MKKNYNDVITAAAFNHAMRLIEEYYPDMPNERKMAQALRLAEKICKREKH